MVINLFKEDLDKTRDLKVRINVANKVDDSGPNAIKVERITLRNVELSLQGVTNMEKKDILLKTA